jgi:hypothetical protein
VAGKPEENRSVQADAFLDAFLGRVLMRFWMRFWDAFLGRVFPDAFFPGP